MHKNLSEKFRIRKEIQIIDKFKLIFKQDIKCDDYIIEVIFDCVKDLYIFFCKEIDFISKEDDQYNFYLLKSNNNGYPLLEFLLNRVCQNIEQITATIYSSNQYDLFHKEIDINLNRYKNVNQKYTQPTKEMFLKKSIYHETIHAIQSLPISYDDKNEYVCAANGLSDEEQKINFYNKLMKYKKYGFNVNDISYDEILRTGVHKNCRTCSESINKYRAINEAFVEMLANELSGLKTYVDKLNPEEKVKFYELSNNGEFGLLVPNPENGYKYNSHFSRVLLNLVGRKNFFFELFTQRNDLFLDLYRKKLADDNFEKELNDEFSSNEQTSKIDNYLMFIDKYFYLYEAQYSYDEDWLPLILNQNKYKR